MNKELKLGGLGVLRLIEVYEYYDGPRLFSCESRSGQKYLALWAESALDLERWLLLPLSTERLDAVRRGRLDLRQALRAPEDDWIWQVAVYFDNREATVERIAAGDLDNADLPAESVWLHVDNPLPALEEHPSVQAQRTGRDVLNLALHPTSGDGFAVEAHTLGHVLLGCQRLVYSLGFKDGPIRGRMPKVVEEQFSLQVVGVFASSFGVRLESKNVVYDLFSGTTASMALAKLVELLMARADPERLNHLLPLIGARAASRYRYFLHILHDGHQGLEVNWGSPNGQEAGATVTYEEVNAILKALNQEPTNLVDTLTVEGRLVGIDVVRERFRFIAEDGTRYVGSLGPDMATMQFEVPYAGVASIEEELIQNTVTGEEQIEYRLMSLK